MYIFKKIFDLQNHLAYQRNQGKTIGFAPTMGALHQGHVSLIAAAKAKGDYAVCSIFVNPTQFNDPNDFAKYPRTTATDCDLLIQNGCDVLFLPDVDEMYPPNETVTKPQYDLGGLDLPMEGAQRPGHFAGMLQVVEKLLNIVMPDHLYMGQKDFQQLAIVRRYLQLTQRPIELFGCPTLREPHGLAMSSRNERLTSDQRQRAAKIYQALSHVRKHYRQANIEQLCQISIAVLEEEPDFKVEYLEVCNAITLQSLQNWDDAAEIVACIALKVGDIRLIDNVLIP
ncbi:MAG: pantoate--beta-alanine ligase [Chitinophagales bacterium]|jgi:pantoate--beta-alanine ligase|nr:pantoate--beta-alanine ligase [Chitinophagales bacterium]